MQICYSNNKPEINNNSIFLAGPTKRNSDVSISWRMDAVKILEKYNFNGIVHIPEYSPGNSFNKEKLPEQIHWKWQCLDTAGVIMFWMPRSIPDMLGLTTNIEFGRHITLKPDNVVLGFPKNAQKMFYLEELYQEVTNRIPCKTLQSTIQKSLDVVNYPAL